MASQFTLPVGQTRPKPASAPAFNLPSDSSSADDDNDDDAPLPFPAALPRSDFLATDFQPAAYLSALPHRHQTLEDLRSDLRDRSATISAELLELVNSNYAAFLSLGDELRGGDERVEDVRVALLGFRRAVEDVKGKVVEKRTEASRLSSELRDVRSTIEAGRQMIEVSERLTALEERLSPDGVLGDDGERSWEMDDSDDEQDDEEEAGESQGRSTRRLQVSARQCAQIMAMSETLDPDHPFVAKLDERLARCRNTLLLDLAYAVNESKKLGSKGSGRLLDCLSIYIMIDAQDAAVKVLRQA